jgi:hypothetical protein
VENNLDLKSHEMVGDWRKLLYRSQSIIRIMKSRRIRWAGHVSCVGEKRNACRVLVGKPEGTRPLGRLDIGGRIILRWILKK